MSQKLEDIRREIDALDDQIHDVLMARAGLIAGIIEEKRKENLPFVHPAREAQMVRRLLSRHDGALPAAAIVRIWRELVGAVSLLQTGLKVIVAVPEGSAAIWDMAKDYFGSAVPMQKASNSLVALGAVREDEASFAVLPWPQDDDADPWWIYVFNQDEPDMKIVCALPYGAPAGAKPDAKNRALVVSKVDFAPSGEDGSFLGLEFDRKISRAGVVDALKALGFTPLSLHTKTRSGQGEHSFHLAELTGYVAADDKRLEKIPGRFEDCHVGWRVMGGYPVPPVYKK